ncbi:MAG: DUF1684 domain-containing protein, partial [Kangiellaceae bacterium]|nr:DUF1684 domain-containing protein [Kangiellaceae bacterium]
NSCTVSIYTRYQYCYNRSIFLRYLKKKRVPMVRLSSLVLSILVLFACTSPNQKSTVSSQTTPLSASVQTTNENRADKAKWQAWQTEYDKSRRSKTGWLSLAGLYWLKEGTNTLGSGSENDHRFPKGMLEKFGSIEIKDNIVTFIGYSDEILIDQKNVSSQALEVNKTNVSYKNFTFYIIKREIGYAIRLQDTESSKVKEYQGTKFYPYANAAAVSAKLVPHKTPKKLMISTVYGTVRENDSAGILEFQYKGKKHSLEAVSYGKDRPMTLMFVDETGQETTYGAGRYLEVEWPKDGDVTTVDFNYAYNPPCAITTFATCPLPPRQNRLDVKINAGELFSGH